MAMTAPDTNATVSERCTSTTAMPLSMLTYRRNYCFFPTELLLFIRSVLYGVPFIVQRIGWGGMKWDGVDGGVVAVLRDRTRCL